MNVDKLKQRFQATRRLVILTGVFYLFLFFAFTLLVRADLLHQFDFDLTVKLQDYLSKHLRLQELFCSFSLGGNFEFTFVFLLIIVAIFARKRILGILTVTFFFGMAHVLEVIGKWTLEHPNPPHFFIKCLNPAFPSNYVQPGFSYPSGHSMRTVFIALILTFFISRINRLPIALKWCAYAVIAGITIVMLISRVSLGEHWPTDVIGGTLLGIGSALITLLFL